MARLRQAAETGDTGELQQAAHALKSSSANVGARSLAALCRRVEEGAREGVVCEAGERRVEIETEYQRVHAALAAELEGGRD